MIQFLTEIDTKLLLFLNGFHSPFFDKVVPWLTMGVFWIPLYVLILYLVIQKFGKKSWWIIGSLILLFALTDLVSTRGFKYHVKRLRPSREPALMGQVHLVNGYKGGMYGFVSSHAANTFGIALLTSLFIRRRWFSLVVFGWASVMTYTRIYLGVHYPGDIICGAILGILLALLVHKLTLRFLPIEKTIVS